MAKGKKGSGTTYTSKGDRPNVSRSIRNLMRRDRKAAQRGIQAEWNSDWGPRMASFNVDAWDARQVHRAFVKSRSESKYQDLKKRYEQEDAVHDQAASLYAQYREAGVKWSACVQAVKTGWVSEFNSRWGAELKAIRSKVRNAVRED